MLWFFTDPYEEEILYSAIARYHYYSGNENYRDTLLEIFGDKNAVPSIQLPSRLESLSEKLGDNDIYNSKYFIDKHTTFPIYIPFLPSNRQEELEQELKTGNGKGIYTKIGLVAGGICKKRELYYCPICVSEDIKNVGEAYFHRTHQVQGAVVCSKHLCKLQPYLENQLMSKIGYTRLNSNNIVKEPEWLDKYLDKLVLITKSVYYLLNHDLRNFNQQIVFEKYRAKLHNKGLVTNKGSIRQKTLYEEFTSYYDKEFLELLESNIEYDDEFNWLKLITRKPKCMIHPIRHILFINYLNSDISNFFEKKTYQHNHFGEGPWPCLNTVSDHYKEDIIEKCIITSDYKTRKPVGTFHCNCGFIYSRKGPDKTYKDRYKIGRIKEFGSVWCSKLKKYILLENYSINRISELMSCDSKTVVKYAQKLKVQDKINSNMKIDRNQKDIKVENKNIRQQYAKDIMNLMHEHPEYSRTEIRKHLSKQYTWFYRHDKDWLDKNLPVKIPRSQRHKNSSKVNWEDRDTEIVNMIEDIYKEIMTGDEMIRVTKSMVAKRIGQSAMLYHKINKLPKTNKYLMQISESVEDFQIRRVDKICKELFLSNDGLSKWQIERKVGLKTNYSDKVENRILKNIEMYEMGLSNKCFTEKEQNDTYH